MNYLKHCIRCNAENFRSLKTCAICKIYLKLQKDNEAFFSEPDCCAKREAELYATLTSSGNTKHKCIEETSTEEAVKIKFHASNECQTAETRSSRHLLTMENYGKRGSGKATRFAIHIKPFSCWVRNMNITTTPNQVFCGCLTKSSYEMKKLKSKNLPQKNSEKITFIVLT